MDIIIKNTKKTSLKIKTAEIIIAEFINKIKVAEINELSRQYIETYLQNHIKDAVKSLFNNEDYIFIWFDKNLIDEYNDNPFFAKEKMNNYNKNLIITNIISNM